MLSDQSEALQQLGPFEALSGLPFTSFMCTSLENPCCTPVLDKVKQPNTGSAQ
jgi:hypothetical protein